MDRYEDDLVGSDESSSLTSVDRGNTDDRAGRKRRAAKAALISSTSISALLIDKALAGQDAATSDFVAASDLPGLARHELRSDGLLKVETTSGEVVLLDSGAFILTAAGDLLIAPDAAASAGLTAPDPVASDDPEPENLAAEEAPAAEEEAETPEPDPADEAMAAEPEVQKELPAELAASDLKGLSAYELRDDGLLEVETTSGEVVLLDSGAFTLNEDGQLFIASEAAVSAGLYAADSA
ncbi:MAG: hypothetical protein AAF511_05030, partial [Pseudomonadota bacterium]